jgi:hypothetical protein
MDTRCHSHIRLSRQKICTERDRLYCLHLNRPLDRQYRRVLDLDSQQQHPRPDPDHWYRASLSLVQQIWKWILPIYSL